MKRIRLTKQEKHTLRVLSMQGFEGLGELESYAIRGLEAHGLVKGAYMEGGGVEDARLTNYGKAYLTDNPKLRNAIDWRWVAAIAVATFMLLIIGCALLKSHGG